MSYFHHYEEFEYLNKKVEIVSANLKYGEGYKWTYRIDGVDRGVSYSQRSGARKSAINQILKGVHKQGMV